VDDSESRLPSTADKITMTRAGSRLSGWQINRRSAGILAEGAGGRI